jgi:hypothetical protein
MANAPNALKVLHISHHENMDEMICNFGGANHFSNTVNLPNN